MRQVQDDDPLDVGILDSVCTDCDGFFEKQFTCPFCSEDDPYEVSIWCPRCDYCCGC